MSDLLQRVRQSFPFAPHPRWEELAGALFAALMSSAAALLAAASLWAGAGAMVPHLLLTALTWVFVNRTAGLLAHRVHLRCAVTTRGAAFERAPGSIP